MENLQNEQNEQKLPWESPELKVIDAAEQTLAGGGIGNDGGFATS